MNNLFNRKFATGLKGSVLYSMGMCLVLATTATLAFSQAGQLDTTFGNKGIFSDNFSGATGFATSVALQSDGKIVAVGGLGIFGQSEGDGEVVRLNTNGTLDTSFGSGGVVSIRCADFENEATGVAIQTDGKIVVSCATGIGESELDRLNTNGRFDSSFGNGGSVALGFTYSGSLVLQSDGKIVVLEDAGNISQMQRFDTNGQLDTTFGTNGTAALVGFSPAAIAVLSNGKFLVSSGGLEAGTVVRYTSNGSLDTTFGISGQQSALAAPGLAVQSNGQIVTAGGIVTQTVLSGNDSGFGLTRFNSSGTIDGTFGSHGGVVSSFPGFSDASAFPLAIQTNGDIVAAGSATSGGNPATGSFAQARYLSTGKLDTTFGTNGLVTTGFGNGVTASVAALVIQTDGKIVAAGSTSAGNFVVARYLGQ